MGGVYVDHHSQSDERDLYSSSSPGDSSSATRFENAFQAHPLIADLGGRVSRQAVEPQGVMKLFLSMINAMKC